MTTSQQVRAFDLFCGGGGSSLGARQAGAVPVGGVDLWKTATDAYVLNLPNSTAFTGDITKFSPQSVAEEIGPIDLLLASPECTHHSVAKGNKPRNEESKQLAYQVVRYAEAMMPRWIVVENVIQMKSWPSFDHWLGELHGLGFKTIHVTLDAEDFGVAQSRRRLFIIGDRLAIPEMPRRYRKRDATVRWVLRNASRRDWSFAFTPLDNGRRAQKTLTRAERAIETVGPSKQFIMVYYGSDGAGGFQTLDRPLRTITTLDRFALVKPNCVGHEMRMLQPSELALAMGFPKRYRFPDGVSRRDCVKLIGNAVCPPVMRAIVRQLLRSAG